MARHHPSGTVVALRGALVENVHHVSVAIVTPDGELVAACGDPEQVMILRSTAKPFQAQALFHTGAMTRFDVSQVELALACASHDSMPAHIDAVRGWLDRLGADETLLGCGPHLPGHEDARNALIRSQAGGPTPIHNNCSGKHSGMLASCLAAGWPCDSYLERDHPLQTYIREVIEALAGYQPATGAVDGCSAPTFGLPVKGLARMYAALACPQSAHETLRTGLATAFDAMRTHPEMVAGPTTLDTQLMRLYSDVVAKRGADGGYGMGINHPTRGPLGVGVWVSDGHTAARDCAVLDVMNFLGLSPSSMEGIDPYTALMRRNCRQVIVGRMEAHLGLHWSR